MKKIFVLLTALVLMMAGCGNTDQGSQDQTEQIYSQDTLKGKYADYSYHDTMSVYASFLTGKTADITLTIEQEDSELVFNDSNFKGTCEWFEDGSVYFHRKEVVSQNHSLNLIMEQQPIDSYFVYKDYLIADWAMEIDDIDGELPDGEYTYCSLSPTHISLMDYSLTFFKDGTCEMNSTGATGNYEEYFAGTYAFDDKIILLTFTEGECYGEELSGTCKMALYVDGGKVHSSIYKKVS